MNFIVDPRAWQSARLNLAESTEFLRAIDQRVAFLEEWVLSGKASDEGMTRIVEHLNQARALILQGRQQHALVCLDEVEAELAA